MSPDGRAGSVDRREWFHFLGNVKLASYLFCTDPVHAWRACFLIIYAIDLLCDKMCLDNYRLNKYCYLRMKATLESGKGSRRFGCPEEAAFLEVMRTADLLSRGLVGLLKRQNLSSTQYNVLRILRGAPEGLPCGEVASRMITRDPDVTRLLDRLENRELISRCREAKDRRTVRARITPAGLEVLARLDEPVQAAHRRQLGHLGRERLQALIEILHVCRRQAQ
jgi:DNA-binding MarR family transcriptional regulator